VQEAVAVIECAPDIGHSNCFSRLQGIKRMRVENAGAYDVGLIRPPDVSREGLKFYP